MTDKISNLLNLNNFSKCCLDANEEMQKILVTNRTQPIEVIKAKILRYIADELEKSANPANESEKIYIEYLNTMLITITQI